MHVAHDRCQRGVIDAGQRGSLHERAKRVSAVDDPNAHDREERRELSGDVHHTSPPGRPPKGGRAPTCCTTSSRWSSSRCSTNKPSCTRQMSIERISTAFPLAGIPISSPLWVPR